MGTIIAGADSGGAHIYSAGAWRGDASGVPRETGEVTCRDASGFHAVGDGAGQSRMQFALTGYGRAWAFMRAVLLTHMAKKRAGAALHVGEATDMFAIRSETGLPVFPPRVVEVVGNHAEELEREVSGLRDKVAGKSAQAVRIEWDNALSRSDAGQPASDP